jgi:hypothetical protein
VTRDVPPGGMLALLAATVGVLTLLTTVEAAPKGAPRPGWVYDRLVLSPGGDSLAFLAWLDTPAATGGGPADTTEPRRLFFDLTARHVAVDPEVVAFLASRDRSHLLFLGERGLWWHDRATGRTAQLYFQPPGGGARLYDYAFRKQAPGAIFLVGAPGDREGGLYHFTPPALIERVAEHRPGHSPPPAWAREAEPPEMPQVGVTRGPRSFTVDGTPPLRFDYDGATLHVEPGSAAERVSVADVTIDWASWPAVGGAALVAVRDGSGRPRLLAVTPGRALRVLLDGEETPSVTWLDDRAALVSIVGRGLYRYDAQADTMGDFPIGRPPAWAVADEAPSEVRTLRVDRWPRSARRFEDQQALLGKAAKSFPEASRPAFTPYGRRLGGAGVQMVGVFPSEEAALKAAETCRRLGLEVAPTTAFALDMAGGFDYGARVTPGGHRIWFRRLPAAGGSELWWHPSGGEPERLLSREMTP